jgi:hypothetical protein
MQLSSQILLFPTSHLSLLLQALSCPEPLLENALRWPEIPRQAMHEFGTPRETALLEKPVDVSINIWYTDSIYFRKESIP